MEAFEFVEGGFVGALGGIDAALEADEYRRALAERVAEGRVGVEPEDRFQCVLPNLGVDFGEAAELPVVADEGVEVVALFGGGGLETLQVFGGEGFEGGGVFAADDFGLGVDAGFEGVHG